jgi:uncharacterized ferritin-like protein (DUF455 family)
MTSLSAAIRAALLEADPRAKAMAARRVARDWRLGRLDWDFAVAMPDEPGRPNEPELLPPNRMPKRGKGGRCADESPCGTPSPTSNSSQSIWRSTWPAGSVRRMGRDFVSDFLSVAADEAMHFALIERHLHALGSCYGALPAHSGLWDAGQ